MGLLVGFFIVALLFGGLGFAAGGLLRLILLAIAACGVFWIVALLVTHWQDRGEAERRAERQALEDETWARWINEQEG